MLLGKTFPKKSKVGKWRLAFDAREANEGHKKKGAYLEKYNAYPHCDALRV